MAKFLRFLVLFLLLTPLFSSAHAPNQSYIYLRVYEKEGIEGRFEINYVDINKILGTNFGKKATYEEYHPYLAELQKYFLLKTSFNSDNGRHNIRFTDVIKDDVGLGSFLKINFKLENSINVPDEMDVEYSGVFEKDDTHRGFLLIEYNWKAGIINNEARISLSFTPDDTNETLSLTESSAWNGFVAMIQQGVWHIWIGLDHILFLLALILPSVVRRWSDPRFAKANNNQAIVKKTGFITWDWFPVERFKPAFLYIVKVVTFFTLAHTITLSLASLEIINLPSRFVESIIALSIGLAAYHNIRPIFKGKDWVIAFVFGLFHGFGFASVLADLGLTSEFLTLSLLGFNIGVELGQLVIILMIFPILYLLRKLKLYPKILVYGSILLIIISLYWFIERAFDVNLLVEDFIRRKGFKFAQFLGLR
ncbi:HupE/UreJ family protein [Aurantibacter sp.]|uniref:HupE/UreJ family protein n=1 Tax=Aurantibacter sp. TaxID=2807103 RepID=UPI0032653900